MTETILAHPELWKGLDDPSDADRAWFQANPSTVANIRPLMPEELEAQDAMASAACGSHWQRLELVKNGRPLPITHVVVVDVLRVAGVSCGPDGESCRLRIPCSKPFDSTTRDSLMQAAIDLAISLISSRKRRTKPKGFA